MSFSSGCCGQVLYHEKLSSLKTLKVLPAIVCIAAFAALGFFREWVFRSLNLKLSYIYHDAGAYSLQGILAPLNDYTYNDLYFFKFPVTAVFILLYFLLTVITLRWLFPASRYFYIPLLVYGLLAGCSFGFYLVGWLSGSLETWYTLARYVAGLLQSPLPAMLMIPAVMLRKVPAK